MCERVNAFRVKRGPSFRLLDQRRPGPSLSTCRCRSLDRCSGHTRPAEQSYRMARLAICFALYHLSKRAWEDDPRTVRALKQSAKGALLELASDVGKRRANGQSLEEAVNIAASLRNLRPKVLDTLLSHCTRVKVVKLVRDFGEANGLPWGKDRDWARATERFQQSGRRRTGAWFAAYGACVLRSIPA